MNSSKSLLMVFVKNPELGKAKTRLAATIGNEKALEVYIKLLTYTHLTIRNIPVVKEVHYAENIIQNDLWSEENYVKKVQHTGGLGERMESAFHEGFQAGFEKMVIIGSDCPELSEKIINAAFDALDNHNVVFGPAEDGGYYLLGMNQMVSDLFQNKEWSTAQVLEKSIQDCKANDLSYTLLPTLSDVDYESDWKKFEKKISEALRNA